MSNAALNAAFKQSRSNGVTRLVLLSIADRADEHGKAWCGAKDIAARANISRQNVARAVKDLCELGELICEYRKPRCCNVYQITDRIMARQSQDETVSLRRAGSLKVSQRCSQGDSQTPMNPKEPKRVIECKSDDSLSFPDVIVKWNQTPKSSFRQKHIEGKEAPSQRQDGGNILSRTLECGN